MEMVVANGKMGSYGLGRNGFPLPHFSTNFVLPRRLLVTQKPIIVVNLNTKPLVTVRCGALTSGKKESPSLAEQFLEKECQFRPTFDDYLKVMESVRFDRSKFSGTDVDGDTMERKSRKNSGVSGPKNKRGGKLGRSREVTSREEEDVGKENRFGIPIEGVCLKDSKGYGKNRESSYTKTYRSERDAVEGFLVTGRLRKNYKGNVGKLCDEVVEIDLRSERSMISSNIRKNAKSLDSQNGKMKYIADDFRGQKDLASDKFLSKDNRKGAGDGKVGLRMQERTKYKINSPGMVSKGCALDGEGKIYKRQPTNIYLQNNVETKQGEAAHQRLLYMNMENRKCESEARGLEVQRQRYDRSGRNSRNSEDHMFDMDSNSNEPIVHSTFLKKDLEGSGKSIAKWNASSSLYIQRESRSQGYSRILEGGSRIEKYATKTRKTGGSFGEHSRQAHMAVGRDIDTSIEDRAAFKTFEVFTDVRNRPRVLRMEMEERIRNLAKWLNATDVNMPEWQFSRMMHNAKIKFTDHSILRVVQILGEFGNWRRVLQVVEWLKSRERFKSYKSKYIYTAVLDALGKAKRPMEALNIFHGMRLEKASYPDLAAYHCIAVTLGQAGLMKELFDVMDCMKSNPKKKMNFGLDQKMDLRLEPDLVVYNAVLNACIQQKQWEGAFWVLQQLKQQGIRPSSTTYGLVMEVMLACDKYNLVHEFFRKVEKTSIPNMLNYKVLVNTLWRENRTDEAVLAVQDMERRGIVGSASLYYDLARCLCSAGRCQEALSQIGKVCKVAKKPLVVTYTGLIQACVDSGSIENGAYIFSEMRKFCSPNVVTCNIMLKSYIEHGMYKEAVDLFQKILVGSHHIRSKSDLKAKIIPDKFTFNTMMEASIAAGNWDDFENAYIQMLHHGYHFDKKRHMRMVMDAFRAGKEKVLETTWDSMVQSGRILPPAIIKERFCMKIVEDDFSAAFACLDVPYSNESDAFSTDSWLNLLKFNADSITMETISRLTYEIKTLVQESDQLSPVLQNLLNACLTFLGPLATVTSDFLDNQTISSDSDVLLSIT